jgi:hypothetical protein
LNHARRAGSNRKKREVFDARESRVRERKRLDFSSPLSANDGVPPTPAAQIMKRSSSSISGESKRGRPAKFGRPARLVALTLPEDVIRALRGVDPDIGWAIVRLVEPLTKNSTIAATSEPERPVELAHLPKRRALIVVREPLLRDIPGVTMIPLADGRAFLAFDGPGGIADLELAILDRIDMAVGAPADLAALKEFREILRSWRLDSNLRFKTKSIIVVEDAAPNPAKRLGRLDVVRSDESDCAE